MRKKRGTKYIFVTGGVVSSLGKGLAAASIGTILEARGFTVSLTGEFEHSYVPMLAVAEESTFTAEAQTIAPGELHTITADNWDDLSSASIILAIDEGSDGKDDTYVALQGEALSSGTDWPLPILIGLGVGVVVMGGGLAYWLRRQR